MVVCWTAQQQFIIFYTILCVFLMSHILQDSDEKVAALSESEMVIVVRESRAVMLLQSDLSIRLACETRVSRYEQSRNGAYPDWDNDESEIVSLHCRRTGNDAQ